MNKKCLIQKNKKIKPSGKKIFNIKPRDTFTSKTSPNIANRPFKVTTEIEKFPASGVILSQGGSNHGWSLYLKDEHLCFTVRRGGKPETTSLKVPSNCKGSFQAIVGETNVTLLAGEELNSVKPNDFRLSAQPIDILEVGRDSGGIVGNYGQDFKLTVAIKSATVTLD